MSNINDNLECVDCSPSRKFRNLAGLKGHMQFKHDKTGDYIERPPSKTNAMIQQLLDQQGQLLNQQQALYELLADRSDNSIAVDEPIGVFINGNGNGNGNQGNGDGDQEEYVQEYYCSGSKHGKECGSPVTPGDRYCPKCGEKLSWNEVRR